MTSAEKQTKFFRPKKTRFSGALTLKRRALTLSDDVIDEDFHLPIRIQLQKTEFLPLKSSRKFVLSTLF